MLKPGQNGLIMRERVAFGVLFFLSFPHELCLGVLAGTLKGWGNRLFLSVAFLSGGRFCPPRLFRVTAGSLGVKLRRIQRFGDFRSDVFRNNLRVRIYS